MLVIPGTKMPHVWSSLWPEGNLRAPGGSAAGRPGSGSKGPSPRLRTVGPRWRVKAPVSVVPGTLWTDKGMVQADSL